MNCNNKNNLLDLYFLEGDEHKHSEIKEHLENCEKCRAYIFALQKTFSLLDKLEEEKPSANILDKIMEDVSTSIPKPSVSKSGVQLMPILQIAFGEIFLFAIIYFLKIQLTLTPFWKSIQSHWLIQSIGSVGISVLLVLLAGSFITLSIAPVLLMESNERKKFS